MYSKTCLKRTLTNRQKKILMTNGSLMKFERRSFCNTLTCVKRYLVLRKKSIFLKVAVLHLFNMYVFACWVQNVLIRLLFVIQYELLQTVSISTKVSVLRVNIRTVEQCFFYCSSTDDLVNTLSAKAPDKSAFVKTIFFINHPKEMMWMLKRTVSLRRFF